jgi:hypothetical protein
MLKWNGFGKKHLWHNEYYNDILPCNATQSVMIHSQSMMRQVRTQVEWKGGRCSEVSILVHSTLPRHSSFRLPQTWAQWNSTNWKYLVEVQIHSKEKPSHSGSFLGVWANHIYSPSPSHMNQTLSVIIFRNSACNTHEKGCVEKRIRDEEETEDKRIQVGLI